MAVLIPTVMILIILTAGCGDAVVPPKDIVVFKTDSNGTVEWVTNLDNGMQESAGTILETSDGGYFFAGGVCNNPHGYNYCQIFPRFVKLDRSGAILWDTILNSTSGAINYTGSGGATTALEQTHGDFLVGLNNGMVLTLGNKGMVKNITVLNNSRLQVIATHDGGTLLVGEKAMKFDISGNLQWEKSLDGSTMAIQTSDGRYLLDAYVKRNNTLIKGVTCLSPNGTILWTHELGTGSAQTTSFYESSPGVVDYTASIVHYEGENDFTHLVTTEQLTFDQVGTVIAVKNLSAAGPVARTPDNGYVFVAHPFSDSGKFTTDYAKNTPLHIVRLSADGSTVWDRPLTSAKYCYPLSIITTRDGGYIALVGVDFHYKA